MSTKSESWCWWLFLSLAAAVIPNNSSRSQELSVDVLPPSEWQRIDDSVDRAFTWLASQQQRDGSFPTLSHGQPGVTSLCVMAFLAHGHLPGEGPYGPQLTKAIEYIQSCQKRNGLLALVAQQRPLLDRNARDFGGSEVYNHTISSLVLSEVYSMEGSEQAGRLQPIIEKSLQTSLLMLSWPRKQADRGGLRYLSPHRDSDQATYQLGGRCWKQFFPRTVKTLLANQRADGSWPAEDHPKAKKYGNAYTTALVVLALGAPNQLLPIFQR